VRTRLRRNERLAIERSQQTDVRDCQEPLLQKGSKRTQRKKKCYTALTRLRRNEPLARERVQQGRTRGCHQPHFKKLERDERAEANKTHSTLRMDGIEEESLLQTDPEGPSQRHVRPGTQSMSRLSNSKRHQPSLGQPNHL
jgi:hypothetical protein